LLPSILRRLVSLNKTDGSSSNKNVSMLTCLPLKSWVTLLNVSTATNGIVSYD